MSKKLLRVLIILFSPLLLNQQSAFCAKDNLSPPEKFVQNLSDRIISLIKSADTMEEKKEHFRYMLRRDFDMEAIGRFVLGRYGRGATKEQLKEFLELYEQMTVNTYTSQFDEYKDESVKVVNSKVGNDGEIWVYSVVQGNGKQPIKIRWTVYKIEIKNKSGENTKPKHMYKIYDIYVNGVSMSITQRSEYAAIIKKRGGDKKRGGEIEKLLEEMRANVKLRSEEDK